LYYFTTFGVPLLKGRSFSPDEQRENRRVAIVSQRVGETSWPGEDPVGKRLKWGASRLAGVVVHGDRHGR
jgi:putative ABC transport system permease protein